MLAVGEYAKNKNIDQSNIIQMLEEQHNSHESKEDPVGEDEEDEYEGSEQERSMKDD